MNGLPKIDELDGIYLDMPEAVYREAMGINVSLLKKAVTPLHFKTARESLPEPPTPAQIIGTVTHACVLEPTCARNFVVRPEGMDFRSKEGKLWKDSQTVPILNAEDVVSIEGMRASVLGHPVAFNLVTRSKKEVSVFHVEQRIGLRLKGRLDMLATDDHQFVTVADLKTTDDASEFEREILKWRLHWQAAYYLDLVGATFFVFVVVEKKPPYAVRVLNLASEGIEIGRREYREKLEMIARCERSNHWPGYSQDIEQISLPEWKLRSQQRLN